MKPPNWLNKEFILAAHEHIIAETGGILGVRDESLLESALSRPQNSYHYEQTDIFLLAATYAQALSGNHAFVDGNKRVAFVAADVFLEKNGYELEVEIDNEQETLFLSLAEGKVSLVELAQWYRQNCKLKSGE
jgi:death-on-curing protein